MSSDKEICIGGNRYRVTDDESVPTSQVGYQVPEVSSGNNTVVEQLLARIVDLLGGGNLGGAYRSIQLDIGAKESAYEIPLGIHADNIVIRCDQNITLKFNRLDGGDNIFIDSSEFPFSISGLKLNNSIHTLFVTTGDQKTTVKILAFGLVK